MYSKKLIKITSKYVNIYFLRWHYMVNICRNSWCWLTCRFKYLAIYFDEYSSRPCVLVDLNRVMLLSMKERVKLKVKKSPTKNIFKEQLTFYFILETNILILRVQIVVSVCMNVVLYWVNPFHFISLATHSMGLGLCRSKFKAPRFEQVTCKLVSSNVL